MAPEAFVFIDLLSPSRLRFPREDSTTKDQQTLEDIVSKMQIK